MQNILLINPVGMDPAVPPVGLEYVAESLLDHGYHVRLLDLSVEATPEEAVAREFAADRWDAVGITVRNIDDILVHVQQYFLPQIARLVARVRRHSSAPVILGGAGFSIQPAEILEAVGADYGVAGCGVPALRTLLSRLAQGAAAPGEILREEPKEYLDRSFRRRFADLRAYQANDVAVGVHTVGGCTMQCLYCTYPEISGHRIKKRDPEKVIDEVENLVDQGIQEVFFSDSMFNIDRHHAQRICERLAARDLPVSWHSFFNPRADLFTAELLDVMLRSGLTTVQLGIDSGSDSILETLNKGFGSDDIAQATRLCQDRGVPTSFSVLFGAPGETPETIAQTFALIDELAPDYVDVELGVRIYKPTPLARLAEREGVVDPEDPLCAPTYYPFDEQDLVQQLTDRRDNCHLCYTEQPVYRQGS